mgnify:CR=1 FL=1
MILNLDRNFSPFPLEKEIDFDAFTFSGGEPHLRFKTDLSQTSEVTIAHRVKEFNDMGLILLAVNALRHIGVLKINLFLPYFPAARQDRLMVAGEALTVKVYADLLNSQYLSQITIFDPHSDVTPALLNKCKVIENYNFIKRIVDQLPDDLILVSPDGGALKKIYKVAAFLKNYEVVECSKSRDVKIGKLSGFKVYSEDLEGKDCLIVDDICDGGGTFMGLSKELKAKNAGKLFLAVSHGIFSKGFDELEEYFEKIFTTDSFRTLENGKKLEQLSLNELI